MTMESSSATATAMMESSIIGNTYSCTSGRKRRNNSFLMIAPNPCEESDDDGGPYPSVLFDVLSDLKEGIRDNGPLHPKVGDLWNSLGLIRLHMQRKIDAAVKCHEQAIKIYRANGSDKTTQTQMAACLSDLAACYEQQGDFEGALRLYEEALQILDSPEGESCPSFHRQSIERSLARIRRS